MMGILRNPLQWFKATPADQKQVDAAARQISLPAILSFDVDIPPGDALLAYLLRASGVVEIDRLEIDSPALKSMKDAGVKLAVPLVSQGELIGLLNLGRRRSEQDYSSDDKRLLNTLATQAAPALRVAQLARLQQIEARERERVEQELRVARVIQETLLPETTPALEGWRLEAFWQPARAVSGDFYDFLEFPDGRLGVIVADVTDKGVPAALVMATARSLLRSAAERLVSPGDVLARANDQLCPDIPRNMFVTCLYLLLDPATGELVFANAGHNLPIGCTGQGVVELRATGMPLGLLPGMRYSETQARMEPGDRLLLYSDGLVEAHNTQKEMFGFPRLRQMVGDQPPGCDVVEVLMQALAEFTGPAWEQEDDVTLLTIEREPPGSGSGWRTIAEFSLPSQPGNERLAMERVAELVQGLPLSAAKVERLKTAVGETTMNAMEHGNQYRQDLLTKIQVLVSEKALAVKITDYGGGKQIPEPEKPDLEAKLAGLQSPRGWGLFLIENMVDEMNVLTDDTHHTVELIMKFEE
jgi:serine phosphatase RsbU (regulator of sigma subunit)/anti-sigma regulatory factor (Ser/Thr protein kinase)